MDEIIVIARAHRGQPVKRFALGVGHGHIYLINPAAKDAVERGESSPIGFPEDDVFIFDNQIFSELSEQWEREKTTDSGLWGRLERFHSSELRSFAARR